jgi:transcriptional regulator with XRE-family HTH domain
MHYTQLFRSLREAKGLTLEELSRLSRRHRNTVVNVESGRPVKFKTLAELMQKMGYSSGSPEMKSIALLWLEAITGLPFSRSDTESSARKAIATYRSGARQAAKRLEDLVTREGLSEDQIGLLMFAARHPELLQVIGDIRAFATDFPAKTAGPQLKVAEDRE